MKRGINLGLERDRLRSLAPLGWSVVLAATLLHVFQVRRGGEELATLREEVSRAEGGLRTENLGADPTVVRRLREISASGLTKGLSAPTILALIDASLPPEVTLVAVTIRPTPPSAGLTVDATAGRAEDVTRFQRNLAGSTLVSTTTLLEERRAVGGQLAIRLQVELRTP